MASPEPTAAEIESRQAASRERAERLKHDLDRSYPRAWIPGESGDTEIIVGTCLRLERGRSRGGGGIRMVPVLVIAEQDSGEERSVWMHHTVLRNELSKLRPAAGELICIRYDGKQQPKTPGGAEYDGYTVRIDRQEGSLSWDDVPPPEDDLVADTPQAEPAAVALELEQPVAPADEDQCDQCGWKNGHHANGCPNEIPF